MRSALRSHREAFYKAESEGLPTPQVSNYLGECFMNIAKGLGMKHNFRRYSFLDDMVMDGVITCLKYIKSFDPDMVSKRTNKPVSPLGYFTQICFFAFLSRIQLEEKESIVKWELLIKTDIDSYTQDADEPDFQLNMSEFIKSLGPQKLIDKKSKKEKTDKKQTPSPLDQL